MTDEDGPGPGQFEGKGVCRIRVSTRLGERARPTSTPSRHRVDFNVPYISLPPRPSPHFLASPGSLTPHFSACRRSIEARQDFELK
jgi:hypothetical protein